MRTGRRAWAAGILALLAPFSSPGCATQPIRDAGVATQPAVVSIVSRRGRETEVGTGFLVAPDRVVTCRHAVVGAEAVTVRLADGRQVTALGVLADPRTVDLVLLAVDPVGNVAPLGLSPGEPVIGQQLMVVGSRSGRAQSGAGAVVESAEMRWPGAGTVVRLRAYLGGGMSGAPALDADGRVAAVVAQSTLDGASGYGIPVRFVRALVPGPLEPMATWGARTGAEPAVAVSRAHDAIGRKLMAEDMTGALRDAEALLLGDLPLGDYGEDVCRMLRAALAALGRSGEAVERMRAVVARHPSEAWSHAQLAEALAEAGSPPPPQAPADRMTTPRPR